jgi:glycosyltransferase involved in cell wall biosynthesis
MKSISVIIPCYNCESTIVEAIESILCSALLPAEIVLIDDCSTDSTPEVMSDLLNKYHHLVVFGQTDYNCGPARTRNLGAKMASGEYLFFMDSDTQILPDALANFMECIEKYDAVVGMYDQKPINSGASPQYKALLYEYLLGCEEIYEYDQFSASCAGIRSNIFWELGGFDERFPPGLDFENEEFGHRISKRHKIVLNSKIRVRHHFPYFKKMTRTFFQRTALWVEMFLLRRKFSNRAGTRKTGLTSLALLFSVAFLPLAPLKPLGYLPSLITYLIYLYGYIGFFRFVKTQRPEFLPKSIILNHYYTLIISSGAIYGLSKAIKGNSQILKRFSPT